MRATLSVLIRSYINYNFPVVIEKDEDGWYAFCPFLDGCASQGDTFEETLRNIQDAIKLYVDDLIESGETLPKVEFMSLSGVEVSV